MDTNTFSDIESGLKGVNSGLQVYNELLGDLSQSAGASGKEQERLNKTLADAANNIRFGTGNLKDNLRAIREVKEQTKQFATENKRLEIQLKAIAFATDDWGTRIQKTLGGLDKLGGKLKSIAGFMRQNSGLGLGGFGDVTNELKEFNREMFTTSRQAQILGQNTIVSGASWDKLRKNTTLSRTEMVKFRAEINRAVLGVPEQFDKMTDSVADFQKSFGQGEWLEQFKRLNIRVQDMIPGFGQWIKAAKGMSKAGKFGEITGDIKQMSMAMHVLGADMKDMEAMYLHLTETQSSQDSLMEYEVAAKKRQQLIRDTNLAMGRGSEDALIGIEKGMTKLVGITEKFVGSMDAIPTVLMSIQAIGLSSITSLIGGLKSAGLHASTLANNLDRAKKSKANFDDQTGKRLGGSRLGRWGGAAGAMGAMGVAFTVGTAANSYFRGGEKEGDSMSEKYRANAAKNRAGWELGGSIVGGTLGAVVGGPMGAVIGSQVGKMGAGWLGGEKVDEKFAGAMGSMDNISGMKAFADGNAMKFSSKKGMVARINKEHSAANAGDASSAKRRNMMIQALLKAGYEEKKIKEMGLSTALAAFNADKKRLEVIKGVKKEEFEIYKKYVESEKVLQMMSKHAEQTAASWDAMSKTKMGFGSGGGVAMQKERVEALRKAMEAAKEERVLFAKMGSDDHTDAVVWDKSKMEKKLTKAGAGAEDVEKFRMAMKSGNKEEMAAIADKVGMSKELVAADLVRLQSLKATIVASREASLIEKDVTATRAHATASIEAASYPYKEQAKISQELLEMQSMMTTYVESTGAGMAASFQMRRKEYDLTKQQRKELQAGADAVQDKTAKDIAALMKKESIMKQLADAGVSNRQVSDLTKGDVRQRAAARKEIAQQLNLTGKATVATNNLLAISKSGMEEEIDLRKKVIGLKTKEVQLAVALKEGYLDVINEMTTGSDLVSKLIPDAQRGIVSLHRATMQMTNDDMGGALTRGFVAVNAFRGSMDVENNASRYTPGGFKSGGSRGRFTADEYQKRLLSRHDEQEARGLQGMVGLNKEKSSIHDTNGNVKNDRMDVKSNKTDVHTNSLNVIVNNPRKTPGTNDIPGKATGGRIPGPASSVDNMMGVIDGQSPIKVASGEYIVNARQTAKFLPLLESINSGMPGFAKGGGPIRWGALSDPDVLPYWKRKEQYKVQQLIRSSGVTDPRLVDTLTDQAMRGEFNDAGELISAATRFGWAKNVPKDTLMAGLSVAAGHLGSLVDAFSGPALTRSKKSSPSMASPAVAAAAASGTPSSGSAFSGMDAMMSMAMDPFGTMQNLSNLPFGLGQMAMGMHGKYSSVASSARSGRGGGGKPVSKLSSHTANLLHTLTGQKEIFNDVDVDAEHRRRMDAYNILDMSSLGMYEGRERYATGGLAAGSRNSMSMMGGMKIGVLSLNGKVIGQDISGGLGDEWRIASQNSNG